MSDQNSMAIGHSTEGLEDESLAELARIVAGVDERPVRLANAAPKQNGSRAPKTAAVAKLPTFDLEELLLQELGSGVANVQAPISQPPGQPAIQAESTRSASAASLEEQLLAELGIDAAALPVKTAQAQKPAGASAPLPAAIAGPQVSNPDEGGHGGVADEDYYEPEPEAAYRSQPVLTAQTGKPADPFESLDFSAAFEAEIRQLEAANRAELQAVAAEPARSLATPVMPKPAAITERELEDHFAAAFAQELEIGASQFDADAYEPGEAPLPSEAEWEMERELEPAAEWQQEADWQEPVPATAQPAYSQKTAPLKVERQSSHDPVLGSGNYDEAGDWDQYLPQLETEDPALAGVASGRPASRRNLAVAAGALMIALMLGGGALAYRQIAGSPATSEPLVVKADTSPVKVKPENPGGTEIVNQDQAAYDKVAGGSKDGDTQEQLVSASETPVALVAEAVAPDSEEVGAVSEAKAEERLAPGDDSSAASIPALAPRRVKTMTIKPDGTVVAEAVVPAEPSANAQASDASAFLPEPESAKAATAAVLAPIDPEAQAKDQQAPQEIAQAPALSEPVEAPAPKAETVSAPAPATGGGGWAVQLASQRSAEDAEATFRNLKKKFASVLEGKELAMQRADVDGKGVFYRVRVQAESKEEAAALCERLKAAGGSCFIGR